MKKHNIFLIIILFISFNVFANQNIKIVGTQNIDPEVILSILDENIDVLNKNNINEIIKRLKKVDGIDNVKIDIKDNYIIINIIENLKILDIDFEGLERFSSSEIDEILNYSDSLVFYDSIVIKNFTSEIKNLYNSFGYNNFTISHEIIKTNRLNFINIKFIISEDKISKINKIYFEGNNSFSKTELLKTIKSRETNLLKFFFNSNFKLFQLENDLLKLINFYKENGFRKISIDYKTEFIEHKNKFNIYIYINENSKYFFNNFEINADETILKAIDLNKLDLFFNKYLEDLNKFDNVYNNEYLYFVEDNISTFLFENGLMFFEINILEKINVNNIDIIFKILSTKPKYINKIDIFGNTRTKDKVIRREIVFSEGDPFNNSMLTKSNKNLQRLDLFKNIEILDIPIENDKVNLSVNIEEKQTGQFNIGAAFGTLNGASIILGLNEKNIAGEGRDVQFQINTSDNKTIYKAEIIEPYVLNKKLNFLYGFNYSEQDFSTKSSYNLDKLEVKTGFNYYFNNDLFHSISLNYGIKDYQITNSSTVSNSILNSSGTNTEWFLTNNLSYNKLNSFLRPTKGVLYSFSNALSPPTSSTNGYFKNIFMHKKYFLYKKNNIFSLKTKLGNIISLQNSSILSDNKFSLGGNWMRGFDSLGAGPRDSASSYIGGNNLFVSKLDYTRPLNNHSDSPIDLNIFLDAGKIWDNKTKPTHSNESIRTSYGIGLKFYTPVGPVGFSWAFPIHDETYDINRMFLFTIGNLN